MLGSKKKKKKTVANSLSGSERVKQRADSAEEKVVTVACGETSAVCKHDWLARVRGHFKTDK